MEVFGSVIIIYKKKVIYIQHKNKKSLKKKELIIFFIFLGIYSIKTVIFLKLIKIIFVINYFIKNNYILIIIMLLNI